MLRDEIEQQTIAFLTGGGKITNVDVGEQSESHKTKNQWRDSPMVQREAE